MSHLIWSSAALRDVDRLESFLRIKNPDAARSAVKAIRKAVCLLTSHPEIGRPAEGMLPQYREWVIDFGRGGYVVLYRFDGVSVMLLGIRHGAEDGY